MTYKFNYVAIDDPNCLNRDVLRQVCTSVNLPLSLAHQQVAAQLLACLNEEKSSGLAAPQIGHSLRMIAFQVSAYALSVRADADQLIAPTIWINPSYQPLNDEKRIDWERCFSIQQTMGEVRRYVNIAVEAYTIDGQKVTTTAHNFLARLLQHEIDHTNGILCCDLFEDNLRHGPIEAMEAIRLAERQQATAVAS